MRGLKLLVNNLADRPRNGRTLTSAWIETCVSSMDMPIFSSSRTLTSAWIETRRMASIDRALDVALSRVRGLKQRFLFDNHKSPPSHSHECVDLDVVD